MAATVTFNLPPLVVEVLELDDEGILRLYGDPTIMRRSGALIITLPVEKGRKMLGDLDFRGEGVEGGWDQPSSWTRACRTAAARLREALARSAAER